ncbi:MAG: LuxR C-terminal-related transcriptional regulator [Dysgonamonadaceae bacterium]|jgi:DNA-binding NarL/FixJ family response regulator|nr:LuxR C-terminal-related transcriptional regulator [Dysgonamonadaceae bacterium]
MSYPVKIVIVEPSVILRSGILSVLHRLNTIQMDVFEIGDIEQLKLSLNWQKPDLLILNPCVLSVFSIQQLKKEAGNNQLKCIALQNSLSDLMSLKAYDEVISIYDSAEQINEKLTGLIAKPEYEKRQESVTLREKEIIVCVIKGLTNKEIAEELHLSLHTVISHRRNISSKLQIHSTAGLTIYAIVNKLVELSDINK